MVRGHQMKQIKYLIRGLLIGFILCLTLFPVFYIVSHSLKPEALIRYLYTHDVKALDKVWIHPFSVNLEQYYRILFRSPYYLNLFWNTVKTVTGIVGGQLVIAVLAAYGFSKHKFKGSEILFFTYIVMMLMPFQVTMVPSYIVIKRLNLLDHLGSLIFPGVFSSFGVFFLKQFMESIDDTFLEEARLAGAGELRILMSIMVPMCKPIIVSAMILIFVDYWNMVEQPIIFISTPEKMPLSIYLSNLAKENIHIGFACSVLYMILPILFVLYGQDDLTDGFKITSLK